MGVLPPVISWTPKDDLLLKNAIEAGASLESLARGAVQFSCKFTIKELQERWHALLYDPVISAEASARMIEYERSSKRNKAENSKEAKRGHGKRKTESIRRCYYAMRKKIRNESLNQGDLSFLVAPGDNCFLTGPDGPGPQSMLEDPGPTHYGLEVASFDGLHDVFPEGMPDSVQPCGVAELSSGQPNRLEDSIQSNIVQKKVTQIAGLQANSVCSNKGLMCSDFAGINSSISECETSFHHLQYVSSPPVMPAMPDDGSMRGNDMQAGDPFCVPGDGDDAMNRTSEYDIHAESELNNHMSCADLKDSNDCKEGYFAELSDSLFNFTSDDDMLIIDGGKDVIDKTFLGLSSLLLNSPDDPDEDTRPDIPELEAGEDEYHGVPLVTGLEAKHDAVEIHSEHSHDLNQINSESQMPSSAATVKSAFPEIVDGVIFCALNTEDPEIPCNDNVHLPGKARLQSALKRTQSEANNPSLAGKNSSGTQTTMNREPERSKESHPPLRTKDLVHLDAKQDRSADDAGVKFEAYKDETHNGLGKPRASQGGLCQSSLVVENETSQPPLNRQSSSDILGKSSQVAAPSRERTYFAGIHQEAGTTSTDRNQEFLALDSADPLAAATGGRPLVSDDEQFSESDTDIPYFSDIESMILDMDLGPEEQDSFYTTKVAKYQHEDAKKEIVRLEQNARSYVKRTLAAHGAFAYMYGRHSKHYIKKSEVLLGRGTDDIPVDIDLSREGRANKISRRQAIIKLENEMFILKNIGKCSIYVNGKEVFPGLTIGLHSECLIEIRGMPFIFESDCALVKKYLDGAAQRSDAKKLNV